MDKELQKYRDAWARLEASHKGTSDLLRKLLDSDSSNEDVFKTREVLRVISFSRISAKVMLVAHFPDTPFATYPWNKS